MRKLEALKVGGVQRKKEKNEFCELKRLFFFLLAFHYSFSFALQRWFPKLEVALPYDFKSLKMKQRWQASKKVFSDRVVIDDGQFYLTSKKIH
jgi:hypothetical protein